MAMYPTRRQLLLKEFKKQTYHEQLLHEENIAIEESLGKLQEDIARRDDEQLEERRNMMRQLEAAREEHRLAMEAQREEHRRELEELKKANKEARDADKQELLSMIKGAQGKENLHQVP